MSDIFLNFEYFPQIEFSMEAAEGVDKHLVRKTEEKASTILTDDISLPFCLSFYFMVDSHTLWGEGWKRMMHIGRTIIKYSALPGRTTRQREHIFFRDEGRGGGRGGAYFSVIGMNYEKLTLIKKKLKLSSYIRKFRRDLLQSHIWLTASTHICAFPHIL